MAYTSTISGHVGDNLYNKMSFAYEDFVILIRMEMETPDTPDKIIRLKSSEAHHEELYRLLKENTDLVRENNEILKKLYRHTMIGLVLRIAWYTILIGLPFAVYFYLLQPYFEAFGANYETFRQGMAEIPGLKGIENVLPALRH